MHKQGKIWGHTIQLFCRNNVEIHRIEGTKGKQCSKHAHTSKYNLFFVESGVLRILVWKNDYTLVDETILHAGESCVVAPGEYHRFEVIENAVAFEIYWVELRSDDIVRKNIGGTVKSRRK